MQPPECILLKKFVKELWKRDLTCPEPCNPRSYPSFFEKSQPQGCFTAHTLLCLLELILLKTEIAGILVRSDIEWSELVTAVLLHDIGKLTSNYIKEKYSKHNVLSAVITYTLLRGKNVDYENIVKLCQAILLHHEYRHWSELFREELVHIASTIEKPKGGRIRMASGYVDALGKLKFVAQELRLIGEEQVDLLDSLLYKREIVFPREFKAYIAGYWGTPTLQAVKMYWFLQLVDNRAASCREGLKNYWLIQFKSISEQVEAENLKSILLADKILSQTRSPRILLSLIPAVAVMKELGI